MKSVFLAVGLIAMAGGAEAAGLESMKLANELGDVLASEEACGLKYDQEAIEAFIEKKVAADDMGFTSSLNLMTQAATSEIEDMNASQKTAHCAQIKRVAKSYAFVQ